MIARGKNDNIGGLLIKELAQAGRVGLAVLLGPVLPYDLPIRGINGWIGPDHPVHVRPCMASGLGLGRDSKGKLRTFAYPKTHLSEVTREQHIVENLIEVRVRPAITEDSPVLVRRVRGQTPGVRDVKVEILLNSVLQMPHVIACREWRIREYPKRLALDPAAIGARFDDEVGRLHLCSGMAVVGELAIDGQQVDAAVILREKCNDRVYCASLFSVAALPPTVRAGVLYAESGFEDCGRSDRVEILRFMQ